MDAIVPEVGHRIAVWPTGVCSAPGFPPRSGRCHPVVLAQGRLVVQAERIIAHRPGMALPADGGLALCREQAGLNDELAGVPGGDRVAVLLPGPVTELAAEVPLDPPI